MKGYKVSKEHGDHFEVEHAKDGRFRVAKHALSPETLKMIRGMAEGGIVGEDEQDIGMTGGFNRPVSEVEAPTGLSDLFNREVYEPEQPIAELPEEATPPELEQQPAPSGMSLSAKAAPPSGTGVGGPPVDDGMTVYITPKDKEKTGPGAATPPGSTGKGNAAPKPQGIPLSSGNAPKAEPALAELAGANQAYRNTAGKMVGAYQNEAKAAQDYAKSVEKIQTDSILKDQEMQVARQKRYDAQDIELKRLEKAVEDQKVDPNRLWSSAATGNKVLAVIGILLSGIGSGATGQENLALKELGRAIDRDIEAQKIEVDKKKNLLSENLRRFRDINAAEDMTRAQLLSAANAKMKIAAAQSGSQAAVARAQQAGLKIQSEIDRLNAGVASTKVDAAIAGGAKIDPVTANQRFPGQVVNLPPQLGGGIVIAQDKDNAKQLNTTVAAYRQLHGLLDRADAFQQKHGTSWGPTLTKEAKNLQDQITMTLSTMFPLGVLSETERANVEKMVPDAAAFMQKTQKVKTQSMRDFLNGRLNAELSTRTINFNPSGITTGAPKVP